MTTLQYNYRYTVKDDVQRAGAMQRSAENNYWIWGGGGGGGGKGA